MAIAMRQVIYSLQQEWKERGIQLGAGIGVASGYATIGAVGFEADFMIAVDRPDAAALIAEAIRVWEITLVAGAKALIENL